MTSQTDPPAESDDVDPAARRPEAEPDGLEQDKAAPDEKTSDKDDDSLPPALDAPILDRAGDQLSIWLRSRKLWIAAAAILVVTLAATVVWPMFDGSDDEAEARVREYLEAVRDKDLDSADAIAELSDTQNTQLLTAEALDTNWAIHSVRSQDFEAGGFGAKVTAVLKGVDDERARFDFSLSREDNDRENDLLIDDGHVNVEVIEEDVRHLTVNGARIEMVEEDLGYQSLVLYPGVYRFGHALEDFVDHEWRSQLWAGGSYRVSGDGEVIEDTQPVAAQPWTFNAEGEAKAQELMKSHIDGCVEETEGLIAECPFGAEHVPVPDDEDHIFYTDDLDDIEWEAEEYPEVTVAQQEGVFRFVDRARGTARLTATGERDNGTIVDIDVECEIRTTGLVLEIDEDDRLGVGPYRDHDYMDMWSTC